MSPLEIQLDTMANDPLRPNLSSKMMQQDLVNKGPLAIGMAPLGIMSKGLLGYKGIKGKDVLGRDIPDWADATVAHYTSKDAAQKIAAEGYIPGSGYYGESVSFTPNYKYAEQFAEVGTAAKISPKAKILNLNDPADSAQWDEVLKKMKSNSEWYRNNDYRAAARALGYDGVYDPGAGDLFIYRPSAAQYIDRIEK